MVHATALVVANMVGTGIFVTSGFVARDLGSAWLALSTWIAGGILALCGANAYAELGTMFPRAGGEYVYLSRAFHPAVGFVSGCVSMLVGFAAPIAAAAVACASYAHAIFPVLPVEGSAVALILLTTAVHSVDVGAGARFQTVFTAMKAMLLAAFAAGGVLFGRGDFSHFSAVSGDAGPADVALSLVWVSFAYSGWNAAAYVAGELREPSRTLPRALLAGTSMVLGLYVALNVAFFYAAAPIELGGRPEIVADVAARALFGDRVGDAISGLVAIALISSVSAMIMAGPRVPLAMAEDGLFFAGLARRNRGGAPYLSLALQATIACVLVLSATFEQLLTYVGFLLSIFSALTVSGALVLRWKDPERKRPYRAPMLLLSATAFVGASVWIVIVALRERPTASLHGLLTIAASWLLYMVWARRVRSAFRGSRSRGKASGGREASPSARVDTIRERESADVGARRDADRRAPGGE